MPYDYVSNVDIVMSHVNIALFHVSIDYLQEDTKVYHTIMQFTLSVLFHAIFTKHNKTITTYIHNVNIRDLR